MHVAVVCALSWRLVEVLLEDCNTRHHKLEEVVVRCYSRNACNSHIASLGLHHYKLKCNVISHVSGCMQCCKFHIIGDVADTC